MTHTFAICAYQESPYLEDCIKSVLNQTIKTNVILGTATPNDYIRNLCEKYQIPMFVNEGEHGITQDWNFAYKMADTDCVTIAHQDDIYDEKYVEELHKSLKNVKQPIIFFSDYSEIREGEIVHNNKLLKIKRFMLVPLRVKAFWNSKFVRRRVLSIGDPICCPAVTFIKDNCPEQVFRAGYQSCEDWEAWEMLSRRKGAFVYNRNVLTYHRIHEESETSRILGDNAREWEDYSMYLKFWPKPIAKLFSNAYKNSQKSNDL